MAVRAATPAKSCGNRPPHGIFAGDFGPTVPRPTASFMTLLSTAQHIARDTRKDPRSHMVLIMVAATIAASAVALVAYLLWPTWVARPANAPERLPVSVGATLFNVPTTGDPPQNPAPLRPAGAGRSQLRLPVARTAGCAEARQRRYGRGEGAADRPDLRVDIGPSRHAGARHARAHDLSALSRAAATPVDDGLTMRAFRDGSPYANEDLFSASDAEPRRALHARRPDARHVPERAPRRRRRPDVPLSAELAVAMARCRECDGSLDGADARTEGLVTDS